MCVCTFSLLGHPQVAFFCNPIIILLILLKFYEWLEFVIEMLPDTIQTKDRLNMSDATLRPELFVYANKRLFTIAD